jgi:hypothetical protein
MSISVKDIAVDKCYVTSGNQVRRVLKIENGKVTYEERSKTESGGSSLARTTIGDGKFAREAVGQVPCP